MAITSSEDYEKEIKNRIKTGRGKITTWEEDRI